MEPTPERERKPSGRKVRKGYVFSKDWEVRRAATAFSRFGYNFCWPVRPLRERGGAGSERPRWWRGRPIRVWSLAEWLKHPAVQRKSGTTGTPAGYRFHRRAGLPPGNSV